MKNLEGIVTSPSPYGVKETIDRLETFLQQHGATIYARIDQQAELKKVGLSMSPLEFILFGNPKAGGPVMIENPVSALDLPLKVIALETDKKEVFITYNDAAFIEERYALVHNPASPLNLTHIITAALKS